MIGGPIMGMLYNRLLIILNEESYDSTYYHIALIMLNHLEMLPSMSITSLAELCNVSKSTISKFIRNIGYEDFSEFRYAAVFSENKYHYQFSYGNDVMSYLENNGTDAYILALQHDILATYQSLDWEKIHMLVCDLIAYERVAAFGLLFSETAAIDLQTKLAYNKKFIVTNMNDLKQEAFIEHAKEETLIIVFSDSGEFLDKYQNIEDFTNKRSFQNTKAKVVVITSNEEIQHDPRVAYTILYKKMQNICTHRTIYGILTDIIAFEYHKMKKKDTL